MAFSSMPGLGADLAWSPQRSWAGGASCAPAEELPFFPFPRGAVTASCHSSQHGNNMLKWAGMAVLGQAHCPELSTSLEVTGPQ